jgi:ATP-dependent Lon protease
MKAKPVTSARTEVAWIDTVAHSQDATYGEALSSSGAPAIYPVVLLRQAIVFPKLVAPLIVSHEGSVAAIDVAMINEQVLVAVAQCDPAEEDPAPGDLYRVGVEIKILRQVRLPDGSVSILVQGRQRVQIEQIVEEGAFFSAVVSALPDTASSVQGTEPLMRAVLSLFERCVDLNPNLSEEAYVAAINAVEPGWLADMITATISVDLATKQEVLELRDPLPRLQRVSVLLAKEVDVLELESRIHQRVQEELDKSQHEFFLREQLRVIQRELGEADEQTREIAALERKLQTARLSVHARARADQELRRLASMPAYTPEHSMVRTYLDWLAELPWAVTTEETLDLRLAARVLAENHYGLDKAKDRILEHIAVRRLAGTQARTPILCLVGPPGTGKTSMGRAVAQALGRKFVRVGVGGVRDEAEIRGHRRTYIGAMPGRILHAMRTAGTTNPVLMLDEVDKLANDIRGDPASALLEILDTEQNREFMDHYLDVPYDLSQVFFITTANLLDTVPAPLVDRMEVVPFAGYIEEEKLAIARHFLVPRQIEQAGLAGVGLSFPEATVQAIIRGYTYEAGLRDLERRVSGICRKVARLVAECRPAPKRIMPASLPRYLGPPPYSYGKVERTDRIGVATGLAWTEAGGDLVLVEVTLMPGKGTLLLTGRLGEVMEESGQAALSYARSHAVELGIDAVAFDRLDIHVHLPVGAAPKDGPSAGITMATALISALTGRPVRHDVAMTGEITLRGRVLPVGGLKEKAIAAHRAGVATIVAPKENEQDLQELPSRVRRDLEIVLVGEMRAVLDRALLPAPDEPSAWGKASTLAQATPHVNQEGSA